MSEPSFWVNPEQKLIQERGQIAQQIEQHYQLTSTLEDVVCSLEQDLEPEFLPILGEEIASVEALIRQLEHKIMFPDPEHDRNAILVLSAGAGGQESQHWVTLLFRAYTRWALSEGFRVEVMHWTEGMSSNLANRVTLRIIGSQAYGWLRAERGTHRFCRVSPFDSNGRVHTSFVAIDVMPEFDEDQSQIILTEKDLDISTFKSSGPGGQHVNKTDSAVRIKHLPTGETVSCQKERSQLANKLEARRMLISRLEALEREAREKEEAEKRGEQTEASFGHQIRSYELHQSSYIKDHRTGMTVYQPDNVLDGDFDALMRSFLLSS